MLQEHEEFVLGDSLSDRALGPRLPACSPPGFTCPERLGPLAPALSSRQRARRSGNHDYQRATLVPVLRQPGTGLRDGVGVEKEEEKTGSVGGGNDRENTATLQSPWPDEKVTLSRRPWGCLCIWGKRVMVAAGRLGLVPMTSPAQGPAQEDSPLAQALSPTSTWCQQRTEPIPKEESREGRGPHLWAVAKSPGAPTRTGKRERSG